MGLPGEYDEALNLFDSKVATSIRYLLNLPGTSDPAVLNALDALRQPIRHAGMSLTRMGFINRFAFLEPSPMQPAT